MLLSNIAAGSRVKVVSLQSTGLLRRRMMDLGLIPDAEIKVLRHSPLGDPTAYEIRGTQIALRSEEADQIIVELIK